MTRFLKTLKIKRYRSNLSDEETLKSLNDELLHSLTTKRKATVEKVITLINVLIEKLKVAFVLPNLLQNYKQLEKSLHDTKYAIVLELIANFHENSDSTANTLSLTADMHNVIDYAIENYGLVKYLPKWLNELDHNDKQFLKYMDELKALATYHFARTALSKLRREDELNTLHNRNEQILSDIAYLKKKVLIRTNLTLWKAAAKSVLLFKINREMDLYEHGIRMKATNTLEQIRHKLTQRPVDRTNRFKELDEKCERAEQSYLKYKTNNMQVIKTATDEKNKLLLQLQTITKKYDEVMLQKYRESLELDEELEQVKQKLNELLPIYSKQEAIHYELVVKKEEEEEREHQLLILNFRQNHAAKIIQRWYRNILRARKKMAASKVKTRAADKKKKKQLKK